MTGNRVFLDTNIISALLKGEIAVADMIDAADKVFIPVTVVGELHYGALYSEHIAKNIANIEKVTSQYEVLKVDEDTAAVYGKIKTSLRKKGKPIPENDIWIAAISIQHQLSLMTRDAHFSNIENLDIITG